MAQRVRYSTDDEEPLVEFSILGPLEVTVGGRTVEVGRAKPRTVLAVLLIHVNQVVAVDRLSEALWGDDPPPSATNTLQGYVSHLRRILAADNAAGDPPVIRTQHPGYVLAAPPEAVDARRFQRLAADGRRALIGAEPQRAAETLAAALALWRGTALADFADQPFAIGEAARLEELRLAAEEDLTEAELALGLHGELVGRLRALTERHPLRERLWGQLMVALYREGRQGEALRAFQAARRALTDQLGIDPSPTLRQLEADILAQSPNLDWHRPASSVGPSMVAATGPHAAGRIIGRKDEMALLEGDLRHAIDGAGRIVLVSGEPGIGKTRLVEELARNAVAAGAEVAWGRCYEGPAAAAFWPWMQVVTTLIDGGDEEMVRAALLPGAADIAQIVPQVKEVFPDLELPAVFDADAARCRLYEAVVRFLSRLATSRPLMLAAEDIHWADLPSLELLAVLASRIREARTLIVATFRDVDPLITSPLADTLADLARYPVVSRLELRGLDRPDVGRFLTELTGSQPAPDVVAAIHGRTEGNPFFVSELARLYNTTGDSGSAPSDDGAEVPVGVRDVVLRRVGRLPESTRGQLDVAAVMGREFELDVLFAVSGDDRETTLDLLEPAVRARLIEQSPELATHYRFSHALVSETIYDDLTPSPGPGSTFASPKRSKRSASPTTRSMPSNWPITTIGHCPPGLWTKHLRLPCRRPRLPRPTWPMNRLKNSSDGQWSWPGACPSTNDPAASSTSRSGSSPF